jgi:hypothetical protein
MNLQPPATTTVMSESIAQKGWGNVKLLNMKQNDPERFEQLDWRDVEIELVDLLVPKKDKYGKLAPPQSYLISTTKLKHWRRLGKLDQQFIIDREEQPTQKPKSQARLQRQIDPPSPPPAPTERDSTITETPDAPTSPHPIDPSISPERMDSTITETPDVQTSPRPIDPPRAPERIELPSRCSGLWRQTIAFTRVEGLDKVQQGRAHVIGNVHCWVGNYLSNNDGIWPYDENVAGFVVNPDARASEDFSWKLIRFTSDQDVEFTFHHRTCTGTASGGNQVCENCRKHQYNLFSQFRNEVDFRAAAAEDPNLRGRKDYLKFKTPTVIVPYINNLTKRVKVLSEKVWKKDAALKALRSKVTEVDATTIDNDLLFDTRVLREGYSKLMKQADAHEKEIFSILFQECMLVKRRIEETGSAKGHKCSSLLIKTAMMLRGMMSESRYEQIRQIFGLPTNATLCVYRNADTIADDGLMHETLLQQAEFMDQLDIPSNDFRCYVSVAFDSHTIKDKLGKSQMT